MKEALFYEEEKDNKVRCKLCSHNCIIKPGSVGLCNVRENIDGKLYTLVYGKPVAQHIDPIEKKPLFHFQPGSYSYSIATMGCNLKCKHCQNWDISQASREQIASIGYEVEPEEIVEK
ncbi:MAG TPA: radical SAM protein, partial [Thermoplasmatales archaeon]|nr:radical SAM protein [Thermoplasmatales archaeon]